LGISPQTPVTNPKTVTSQTHGARNINFHGNAADVLLVLQGGGASAAYQAGVYQALEEAGLRRRNGLRDLDGAINASLIAGTVLASGGSLKRSGVECSPFLPKMAAEPSFFGNRWRSMMTMANGLEGSHPTHSLRPFALAAWPSVR